MADALTVAIVTFPRSQVLDVTGPAMVFEAANDALGEIRYEVRIVSANGGPIRTSSAVTLISEAIVDVPPASVVPC